MSIFAVAMMGLGLFLVLYTIAFLVRPGKAGSETRKESLGCGFVLLAGLVWSFALTKYLGDRSAGLRLGLGGALILPALAAIFRPGRKRIVQAAVLFVVAVMVASSALPKLKKRLRPDAAVARLEEMQNVEQDVRVRVQKARALANELAVDRAKLVKEVKAKGVGDFELAAKDPDVMRLLKELAEIDRLQAVTKERLEYDSATFERIESAVRRVERLEKAGELMGETVSRAELNAIIEEARSPADVDIPSSVESHFERTQLETLFSEVVGQ